MRPCLTLSEKPPIDHFAVIRPLLCALTLALLPGCQSGCYYDGPREGSEFTAIAGETATGDASWTQTPFSFAIRYHGLVVDGVPRTGFVSAFGAKPANSEGLWGATGEWPLTGQVVALQGYFAETHPDWLCETLTMAQRGAPGTGGASTEVCPSLSDDPMAFDCAEQPFVTVTTNVFGYEDIFNEEVPEPELFVTSDECEVIDAAQ